MLTPHIKVKNGSDTQRWIPDWMLPNGRVVLAPGDETSLPREVYLRVARSCAHWLVNLDAAPLRVNPPVVSVTETLAPEPPETETVTEAPSEPGKRPRSKKEVADGD